MNLVDKADVGFEMTLILKEILLWIKCYQIALHAYREIICERKSQSMWQNSSLSYFKKLPVTPILSQHHPGQSAAISIEARPSFSKKITTYQRLR